MMALPLSFDLYTCSIALLLKKCRIMTAITTNARQMASFLSELVFAPSFTGVTGVWVFIISKDLQDVMEIKITGRGFTTENSVPALTGFETKSTHHHNPGQCSGTNPSSSKSNSSVGGPDSPISALIRPYPCLKYCTSLSCFFAASIVSNVPRFLRLFVLGFFFRE